jgi:hypothetical protein
MIMFIKGIDKDHASRTWTKGHQLLMLFIGLVFALTVSPGKAHAQVAGEIEANIPFQFHAGDAKLPAGKYVIHVLDNSDLKVMEISSADGSTSALFEVRQTETNSAPAKTELIFNKYGNRYFLAKLFDEGDPNGSTVDKSRYEEKVGEAAAEAQAHVPAHHRGQQGG